MAATTRNGAHGIYVLLNQGHLWVDRGGRRHDIAEMSVRYKRNVIGFLERRARYLVTMHGTGQLEAIFAPIGREVLGEREDGSPVLGEVVYGGPRGEMAQDRFDWEMQRAQAEREDDPVGWLRTTPLLRRLIDDVENNRGGTDGDEEHQRWLARRDACGSFVADGHDTYQPDCGICVEANSDAPEWTLS